MVGGGRDEARVVVEVDLSFRLEPVNLFRTGESVEELTRKRRREYLARITGIVKGGIDAGRFRNVDPDLATLAFLGMCTWAYKWYPRIAADNPPEKMAKNLCDIFLGGLLRV